MNETNPSLETYIRSFETNNYRRKCEKHLMALITLGNPYILTEYLDENADIICSGLFIEHTNETIAEGKQYAAALAEFICRGVIEAGITDTSARTISENCRKLAESSEDLETLWSCIRDMLTHFCREVYFNRIKDCRPAAQRCCDYMHAKIRNALSLKELAQLCHISEHYVSDLFRKEMGAGALQYAHQIKLQYAKYLLEYSEMSISELAAALSYPSHSNFSQRFKKTYGITPLEYRLMFK